MRKCSTTGPSASAGTEGERADDDDGADEQNREQWPGDRETARALRDELLAARDPASARIGTIMKKRPTSMARPSVVLYQRSSLAVRPGEGAAVVAGAGAVGVEDFAEAVRAVVVLPSLRAPSAPAGPSCSCWPRP